MKICLAFLRIAILVSLVLILAGFHSVTAGSLSPQTDLLVNTGVDEYDGVTPNGTCSLREAIQAANTDSAFGGCPAGSGTDTITLMKGVGTFYVTIAGGYGSDNASGDFNITSNMTIQGYGWQTTMIDASYNPTPSRVFHIKRDLSIPSPMPITVTIRDMAIHYGDSRGENGGSILNQENLILENVDIIDSHSNLNGGAIFSSPIDFGQSLTIRESVYYNNSAGYSGGAIANFGELLIEDSFFSGNDANLASFNPAYQGGGLYNGSTPLTIRRSTFSDNQAGGSGGNLFLEGTAGSMLIEDSTLTGGIAGNGNGGNLIVTTLPDYNLGVTLRRTEVSGGQANAGLGGGIYNDNNLTLENVTISGNQAQIGGGIYTAAAQEDMLSLYKNISLTNNLDANPGVGGDGLYVATSSPINIYNSILAMNGPDTILGLNCDCYHISPISSGFNLERGTTCGFTQPGDIQNTDPLMGPLSGNWGFTQTHPLILGSPAIDHGNNATCLATDQRGWYRPIEGPDFDEPPIATCDIGAYEFGHQLFFLPLLHK